MNRPWQAAVFQAFGVWTHRAFRPVPTRLRNLLEDSGYENGVALVIGLLLFARRKIFSKTVTSRLLTHASFLPKLGPMTGSANHNTWQGS